MVSITVRFTEEERDKIKDYGDKHDLTMSQVIRRALKLYFRRAESQGNNSQE